LYEEVKVMAKSKKSQMTATEKIMLAALIFEAVKWLIARLLGG
jgi:hypothetical protein